MSNQTFIFRANRVKARRDPMIYGHFIEHFHRQIYGGVYDPTSRFADEDGFRTDVLEAMRRIHVPILRWPGGCFVSSYNWKKAIGPERTPVFDKAWRVEDPNTFGTDEYVKLCRKIGCAPYICTNAGTGTPEDMSDWVEYCNLPHEGEWARKRIQNGWRDPHKVLYWSIGNENYGQWELGAKPVGEWGRLVEESAKLMKHVDPEIELSAAALTDIDWNVDLLKHCGQRLDWISIHKYWNLMPEHNDFATYDQTMAYTNDLENDLLKVQGLLTAMGLEKRIKIAYDEWNLRGWHHPGVHSIQQAKDKKDYLEPRNLNDINSSYTMADTVFTACFLNTLNRHSDIIGMACFAPIVNTRGCIYTYEDGIVLRGTYHVFDLYVNELGDEILDGWMENEVSMHTVGKNGNPEDVSVLDVLATRRSADGMLAIAAVNKHADLPQTLTLQPEQTVNAAEYRVLTVSGESTESYNDAGVDGIVRTGTTWQPLTGSALNVTLAPHSVNILQIR